MKKLLGVILTVLISIAAVVNTVAFADSEKEITVVVNGQKIDFDVPPITENDRTLVPMRYIFEALGAEVEWNNDTNTATAVREDTTISITIDSNVIIKNGEKTEIDVPARLINDRTLVPIRAVSEGLGASVNWIEDSLTVIIEDIPVLNATEKPTADSEEENAGEENTDDNKADDEKTDIKVLTDEELKEILDGAYPYYELAKADMKELKKESSSIRYTFEQYCLPSFLFDDEYDAQAGKLFMNEMKNKNDDAKEAVDALWKGLTLAQISLIQTNSDEKYIFTEDVLGYDLQTLANQYSKIIDEAGLNASDWYTSSFETLKNGNIMLMLTFKNIDEAPNCKYIGIVLTSENELRYFTAETDAFEGDYLFVCEIDDLNENRGKTIARINIKSKKEDFVKIIEHIISND